MSPYHLIFPEARRPVGVPHSSCQASGCIIGTKASIMGRVGA
jgi:hypothetical protein